MKTIALCFSTPGMSSLEWVRNDYGKKYPGAGWMKHLPDLFKDGDPHVACGSIAIDLINRKQINPKDVYIVQEENHPDGILLQEMGANPSVIMCLESPIFASQFYDRKDGFSQNFKHKLFFDGGTDRLYFPSFDIDDIRDSVPWNDRQFLCMVTANKHYSMIDPWLRDSKSFRWALETQLHDYRYNAIKHFAQTNDFHLYGKGWPDGRECADKIDTIRNYKFALCFENGSYPGYITEKIIDCFVAGVIPIYVGEPDAHLRFPYGSFIDGRNFQSFEQMEHFLRNYDLGEVALSAGASFLASNAGYQYSNECFAKRIMEMCA